MQGRLFPCGSPDTWFSVSGSVTLRRTQCVLNCSWLHRGGSLSMLYIYTDETKSTLMLLFRDACNECFFRWAIVHSYSWRGWLCCTMEPVFFIRTSERSTNACVGIVIINNNLVNSPYSSVNTVNCEYNIIMMNSRVEQFSDIIWPQICVCVYKAHNFRVLNLWNSKPLAIYST